MTRWITVAIVSTVLGAPTALAQTAERLAAPQPQAVVSGPPVDQSDATKVPNALSFGEAGSGQGIGSKRGRVEAVRPGVDFYTGHELRATIANDGNVGVGTGTAAPRTRLDVRGADTAIELRNTNDGGRGGVVQNTYGSVQMGMFAEQGGSGQVPAGSKRAFFGYDSNGKVGSLTNSMNKPNAPAFRNVLDDGQGNAKIEGNISARNLPAFGYQECEKRVVVKVGKQNLNVTLCEIAVDVPGPGVLYIEGRASGDFMDYTHQPDPDPRACRSDFDLKLDEVHADGVVSNLAAMPYRMKGPTAQAHRVTTLQRVGAAGRKKYKLSWFKTCGPGGIRPARSR